MIDQGNLRKSKPTKPQKTNKKETTIERGNPCGDSETMKFPLQGGSHASSSHEASLEPTTKRREDLGKYSVYTHFPKDRNCEICKRTKITRAPCRRRNGEAVPRAANFGDLISSRSQGPKRQLRISKQSSICSRVQDLATQWIQAYPCKNKSSQETSGKLAKVPGTREETKSHLH